MVSWVEWHCVHKSCESTSHVRAKRASQPDSSELTMSELDDEFAEYADDPELLEMMKAERELSKKAALEAEQKVI